MSRATEQLLRQHTDSLDLHLRQCRTLPDVRLRLLCWLERLDAAISERLFTTVVLGATLMVAVLSLVV